MDQVSQLSAREIAQIILPTRDIFVPLLEKNRSQITGVSRRTLQYGPTERHQLDVYFPNNETGTTKSPILFFVYGGGFVSGAKSLDPPADLAYANVAAYFTAKGFITIIPDYQLMPNATFPTPARDVLNAVRFMMDHREYLEGGDQGSVFLMGHSAGAVNVVSILTHPELSREASGVNIKGVVLVSGPYDYDPEEAITASPEIVQKFYGGLEETKRNCPIGLLKAAPKETLEQLPPVALVEGEYDPDSFKVVAAAFQKALKGLTGQDAPRWIAPKHNHLSLSYALGTGQGEEWAQQAAEWMKSML
ncbi:hypothetical protein V5O48_005334 [Marasmius crinis-equi]|uniref:BD-FAE-like domain-containing protein n=1 Tax=Marasmius crinis-equi TaxID=585013 RepID=A0ABR3FMP3_9AGAR